MQPSLAAEHIAHQQPARHPELARRQPLHMTHTPDRLETIVECNVSKARIPKLAQCKNFDEGLMNEQALLLAELMDEINAVLIRISVREPAWDAWLRRDGVRRAARRRRRGGRAAHVALHGPVHHGRLLHRHRREVGAGRSAADADEKLYRSKVLTMSRYAQEYPLQGAFLPGFMAIPPVAARMCATGTSWAQDTHLPYYRKVLKATARNCQKPGFWVCDGDKTWQAGALGYDPRL